MKHGIYMLLGAAALSFFGLAAQAQDIKLGFNGDLSASPSALSGQAAVLGLQAAIEDVNAAGGVLGRKLTLVIRDDLSQPPKSIQNMSDLIDNEKVVTVFGPTNSGNALAWKQVPNQKKIPVIGTVGSGTAITYPVSAGSDNYMFRISMVDRDQVAGLMAYVKKNNLPGGDKRVTNDPMEATYIGIHMWAQAVEQAKSTNVDAVRQAVGYQHFKSPSGFDIQLDAKNHHLWKPVVIGEVKGDGQFHVVWKTEGPIRAQAWSPFIPDSAKKVADWTYPWACGNCMEAKYK
jgi:ABC-type branched-subunit amino acid transport system substrate-binding protein